MQSVSSAFWLKLQQPNVELVTLIDLTLPNTVQHWALSNKTITAPWSGTPTPYIPAMVNGQGMGQRQSSDLSVDNTGFVFANSDSYLSSIMETEDLDMAAVSIRRVFTDTPGLGFLQVFEGQLGEQTHDRQAIQVQARNRWQALSRKFPHLIYQDLCIWRFGAQGCGFDVSTITLTFSHGGLDYEASTKRTLVWSPTTLTQSYANDWFALGRVTFSAGQNNGIVRTIRSHSGDVIELSRPLPFAIDSTDVFSMHAGCRRRLIADCASKYNNVQSGYCGFSRIPILEDGNQPRAAN